ncbi:MAG TPA: hypothetical protein VJ724_03305 [Tahibacter sp.]|nr:hypothetical protein [Tahibacter sp.]
MNQSTDLLRQTNIDELLPAPRIDPQLPQPAIELPAREPFRLPFNTMEPFQSQHYLADVAANLTSPHLTTPTVVAGWLFFALPAFGYWLIALDAALGAGFSLGAWVTIGTLLEVALATVLCGLWPYLLLRGAVRRQRRADASRRAAQTP